MAVVQPLDKKIKIPPITEEEEITPEPEEPEFEIPWAIGMVEDVGGQLGGQVIDVPETKVYAPGDIGVTLPEGWGVKLTPAETEQGFTFSLIEPGGWELFGGDVYVSPEGEAYSLTQMRRLAWEEEFGELRLEPPEEPETEIFRLLGELFPERGIGEAIEYYFPEVEDINLVPPAERIRVEEEQRIATERWDEFLGEIREFGRTPGTESLLRSIIPGITEQQLASVFLPSILNYDEKIAEIKARYPEVVSVFDPVGMRMVIPEDVKKSDWYERMREEQRQAYIDYGISEAPIKNAWDAFILSGKQLVHKTAQFFTSTIPNFFFGEGGYGDIVGELAGFKTVFSKTEFARTASDNFRRIFAQNEQKNTEWLARHPELQPKPEYAEGSKEHPELWKDPGWYIYIIADNISFSLGVVGVTFGTTLLTGSLPAGIMAGVAVATPSQSYDLYEDLVRAGAPEGTAGIIALPVGVVIASIESVANLPLLGAINPAFKLFSRGIQEALVKQTVFKLLATGVKTFTIIEVVETLEEVAQGAIHNYAVSFFDENREVFENVDVTIFTTLVATLPFAIFGGAMSMRHVGTDEASGVTTRQKLADGWEQDSLTGEWYRPTKLVDSFAEDYEKFREQGLSEDEAKLAAYNEAARTPEGEEAIRDYVAKEITLPEQGVYKASDVFTTPEGAVTLDIWAVSQRQWAVIEPDGTTSYMKVAELDSLVAEGTWVKKPVEAEIIPEAEKIDELSALHIHPARVQGFKVSTKVDINDYLTRLKTLAQQEARNQVPMVSEAIRSFKEGDLSAAAVTAENVLSRIHVQRTLEQPGYELEKRVRTPEIDRRISEIEELLARPSRLPTGVGTKPALQIELAELQARRNAAEFQTIGTFREAIEDIENELGNRARGIAKKLLPEYTSKQLDARLKVYKEAEARFLKGKGVTLDRPLKPREEMTPAEARESELIPGNPPLTLEQSDALLGFFGEYIADPNVQTAWELTRELRRETRAERAESLRARAEELIVTQGIGAEEAMAQATKETLAGELPVIKTEYLSELTNELRDALYSRLYHVLKNEPFEMASTATALTNALLGKPIPREPGVRGGSAYTRLMRVFGKQPKVFHAIEQGAKEGKAIEDIIEGVYREWGQPPIQLDQETVDYLRGLPDKVIRELPLIEPVPTSRLDKFIEAAFGTFRPNLTFGEKQTINRVFKELLWLPIDIGNFLRANKASFDMSFWRQVKILTPGHLGNFYRGNVEAFKALFSQKAAEANWEWIKTRPSYPYYANMVERTGQDFLRILVAPKGTAQWRAAEEFGHLTMERLLPRITARIPWIKWSGRAFVTGTNTVTMMTYDDCLEATLRIAERIASGEVKLKEGEALNIQNEMDDYAKYITDVTQRASLGKAAPLAPALGATFFATRSKLGRLLTPRHLVSANPRVRRLAWKDLSLFVSTFGGLVMLGVWLGLWETDTDPRSGEFMSIRIGNLRIDPWAGNRQFVVLYARLITGTGVSSVTGAEYEADPLKALTSFTRTSLAPFSSIIADFWTGRNFLGDEVDVANVEQWIERIAPFAVWDVWEAFAEGWGEGAISILPAIFGEGVQTYTGDWEENFTKLGLPKYIENTAYGITEPVYDVKDFWADVSSQFKGVELSHVTEAKGYPEYIRSMVEARNVILPQVKILPNMRLHQMNDEPSVGPTFIQYYQMWRDREKIVISGDEETLAAFDSDERTRNAYLGNITQGQYSLLVQYNSLSDKDKADFLEKHPELNENPRESWLKAHPRENAVLAIWGQEEVMTKEAFNIAETMIKDLDIPESAIRPYIPSREVMIPYFEYQDIISEYGASSSEAKLLRINNPEFQTWGVDNKGWSSLEDENIKALELNVKLRKQDAEYEAIQYENESKQREERAQYLEDNPEYADDRRRRDAHQNGIPVEFIEQYVEYYRLPLGKPRTAYRRKHTEFSAMMEDPSIRGDDAWKPLKPTTEEGYRGTLEDILD